jgi:hypothetical protein
MLFVLAKKKSLVSHQISEIGGKQPWPVMNSIISLGKLVPSPGRLNKKEIDLSIRNQTDIEHTTEFCTCSSFRKTKFDFLNLHCKYQDTGV